MERTSIKVVCAALDERENEIILRGVIDADSLKYLQIADYQRDVSPQSKISNLMNAIRKGGVPDIQLGCRGGSFFERDDAFYIQDDVFIIDGLQRRTAAMKLIEKGLVPHIGVTIYFNTTEKMERERFRILNVTSIKLSPNVLLRNARHDSPIIASFYQLCLSSQFALQRRVCWSQSMKRGELLTAMILLKTSGELHRRFGPNLACRRQDLLILALDRLAARVGRTTVITNVREYFDAITEAFKINEVVYREIAPALRHGFLLSLANVFSRHEDFWQDAQFVVSKDLRRKLSTFPITDPQVAAMCAASGSTVGILTGLIVNHFNSGKRTKRLRPFNAALVTREEEEEEIVEEQATALVEAAHA